MNSFASKISETRWRKPLFFCKSHFLLVSCLKKQDQTCQKATSRMSSSTEAMDTSGGSPPAAAANLSESTSLSALRAEFETRDETVKQKIMLKEVILS